MPIRKIWEVEIDVVGPITIESQISFRQKKGFDEDQFYSNITLRTADYGIASKLTAYADNMGMAQTAAYVFFGRMIDILAFTNHIPLTLQSHENIATHVIKSKHGVKRMFTDAEFMMAFIMSRKLEVEHPRILKAIGWYAKGINSNNALDSFLSLWNAIEIIGTHYHAPTDRAKSGAINQIYQCFLDLWGDESNWELPCRWINDMHDKRSKIAHGVDETTVEALNNTAVLIPKVSNVARNVINATLNKEYGDNIWDRVYAEALF